MGRVGAKADLEKIVEDKQGEATGYASGYLAAGILCLLLLFSPCLATCIAKVKEGALYKAGPFAFMGQTAGLHSARLPSSIGAASKGNLPPANLACPSCDGSGQRGLLGPVGFGLWTLECRDCKG